MRTRTRPTSLRRGLSPRLWGGRPQNAAPALIPIATRVLGIALISGLWLGLSVPQARADVARDPVEGVLTTTLPNGLTVLTLEDHNTPVVSFQIWVQAGSKDEGRYTGLAHLFEHMMFKGSRNIQPEVHARLVEARGGRINAYTTRDVTVYYEDVTAESLPLVIDLEAERFAHLDVSEATLKSEREVVIEERRLRVEDRPSGRGYEALFSLAFPAHSYGWPVIGWKSDLEAVDVAACRDFFDTYYAANNLVVVVVGDFETETTLERIRARFGGLRRAASIPRNVTRVEPQHGPRRTRVHMDLQSPLFLAAWHAPAAGHADAEALDVASAILSDGRSSRLYRALVYEAQKALYASGGYYELQEAGLFFASAAVRPGASIEEVESLFLAEIEAVRRDGVTSDELAKAKRQLEVALVGDLDTNSALASRIGREWVTFGRVRPLAERLAAIEAVTAADVQRVVQTYVTARGSNTVHVVPNGSEGAP
ncbi:MAG: insulinase family protein [Proteobacteria bacterium]|nr:insulinase family protein [Pseudomonadota bacterium]